MTDLIAVRASDNFKTLKVFVRLDGEKMIYKNRGGEVFVEVILDPADIAELVHAGEELK